MKINKYIVGFFYLFWLFFNCTIGLTISYNNHIVVTISYLLIMFIINIGIAYDLSLLVCATFSKAVNIKRIDSMERFPKVALLYLACDDALHESLSILNNQTYNNYSIFVLDDSRQSDNKTLIDGYSYQTIRRGHRRGAKAGNINNWLFIYGNQFEYFVVLDNGGMLEPTFIEKMLQYAEHPENSDTAIFQSITKAWNTQRLFTRILDANFPFEKLLQLRVFNHCDSMFCWGHNILCRTKPFLKINGFDERFATEDIATNLRLIECGYNSKAVDIISYDLASETVQFHATRLTRWARGNLETAISKSWNLPFATKLRMLMGVYHFSRWPFYLIGMIIVIWGYKISWNQIYISFFLLKQWNQFYLILYPMITICFYIFYGTIARPIWVKKLTGIPLKTYWIYGILYTSVCFFALFPMAIGQIKSIFGSRAGFVIAEKRWFKTSLWGIITGMRWTVLASIFLAAGLLLNPVACYIHFFWYVPLFCSPLILHFIQNIYSKRDESCFGENYEI